VAVLRYLDFFADCLHLGGVERVEGFKRVVGPRHKVAGACDRVLDFKLYGLTTHDGRQDFHRPRVEAEPPIITINLHLISDWRKLDCDYTHA